MIMDKEAIGGWIGLILYAISGYLAAKIIIFLVTTTLPLFVYVSMGMVGVFILGRCIRVAALLVMGEKKDAI